jgi:5-methylcytosine-specific restriction endonuclease McrA
MATTNSNAARYTTQLGRAAHSARPGRESLSKRLGAVVTRAIQERDRCACVYCGATAATSGAHLHLDHLTPKSAGGADDPRNLVLACRGCNSARQAMSLTRWAAYARETRGLEIDPRAIRAHARRVSAAVVAIALAKAA